MRCSLNFPNLRPAATTRLLHLQGLFVGGLVTLDPLGCNFFNSRSRCAHPQPYHRNLRADLVPFVHRTQPGQVSGWPKGLNPFCPPDQSFCLPRGLYTGHTMNSDMRNLNNRSIALDTRTRVIHAFHLHLRRGFFALLATPATVLAVLGSLQSNTPYQGCGNSAGTPSAPRPAVSRISGPAILILSLLMSVPVFAQVPTKDPAGIFDGLGNFNAAAYVDMAQDYGTAEMIPERFGPASTGVITTTVPAAANLEYSNPLRPAEYFFYSLGTPCQPDGDYSSNYAQVAYIFDPTVQRSVPGVDGIQTLDVAHCVWAGQPQLAWQTGGGHGGQPTIIVRSDMVARLDPYGTPQQPVEVVRAYGASEDAGCSYMVFQSGQIVCGEGGNTAKVYYYSKPFPTNFTPTAASVTNNGEFLLVVGWNTTTMKGQLAVLAMGSSKPTGTFWSHEWDETYPGFRNYSLPVFSKLLGIIDLPGMVAPTMVNAVGNWEFQFNLPGQTDPGKFPLSVQANWRCFATGSCMKLYDTSGFALVGSRYERKVLLLNLAPLFKMVTAGMFTDFATFRAHVANTGINPGQWPPTFAENPAETPVVVKTILYPGEVTAVSSSVGPDNRALIATLDGQVHIWDVDGLQTGGTGANAHEVSTVTTGVNTTRLANLKHGHGGAKRLERPKLLAPRYPGPHPQPMAGTESRRAESELGRLLDRHRQGNPDTTRFPAR